MITKADIAAYYNLTLTAPQETLLDDYILPAIQTFIEKYCNRVFDTASFIESFEGGVSSFFVKNPPIISVTSVKEDTETLPADDYRVFNTYVKLYSKPANHQTVIEIDYEGGFATFPADLAQALIKWAYDEMKFAETGTTNVKDIKRFTAGSVTVEYESETSITKESESQMTLHLPDYVTAILRLYRLQPIK